MLNLEIKESKIKNAGHGLFTNSNINEGELICEFTGTLIKNDLVEKLNENKRMAYLIEWDDEYTLDVEHSDCLAKFANDAEGYKKIKGLSNNSEIAWYEDKLYLKATKKINAGEEIYASYGNDYWENI